MKKLITTLLFLFSIFGFCNAQNALNGKADNIIGDYSGIQSGFRFKVRITKNSNNTYKAQIIWMENDRDEKGNKYLDVKNPDKSLRTTPCDRIVIIKDLHYNNELKQWGDAKIYDPVRGIRANVTCLFTKEGKLKLKGTVLGIGETVYWNKIK